MQVYIIKLHCQHCGDLHCKPSLSALLTDSLWRFSVRIFIASGPNGPLKEIYSALYCKPALLALEYNSAGGNWN